jgi:hypothetical protein
MEPLFPVLFDLETRSKCDLKREGSWRYGHHPTTEIMSAGWWVPSLGEVFVWSPLAELGITPESILPAAHLEALGGPCVSVNLHEGPTLPPWLPLLQAFPWTAHNGWSFDRVVWRERGLPLPTGWEDTLHYAALLGLPRSIDAAGKALLGLGKDKGGETMLKLSLPIPRGRMAGHFYPLGRGNLPAVLRYMVGDCFILGALAAEVEAHRHLLRGEVRVIEVDRAINDRGVGFDAVLASKLMVLELSLRDHTAAELADTLAAGLSPDTLAAGLSPDVLAAALPPPPPPPTRKPSAKSRRKGVVTVRVVAPAAPPPAAPPPAAPPPAAPPPAAPPPAAPPPAAPVTGDDVRALLRSQPRSLALLQSLGVGVEDLRRATLQGWLETNDADPFVRDLILARIGETRITSAKLRRGVEQVGADGRIRGSLFYHGAHTGRWAGRGMQLHNLPRPSKKADPDKLVPLVLAGASPEDFLRAAGSLGSGEALSALIRSCFVPEGGGWLGVADYSNIEARVLLWNVGDEVGLDVFRGGGDPYKAFAGKLWGVCPDAIDDARRSVGKVGVLGCGFGLGRVRMAGYAASLGVDLEKAGTSPEAVVEGWRDANPLVAGERTGREWNGVAIRKGGLWKDLEAAFVRATRGEGSTVLARVEVSKWKSHTVITLPSGRALIFRNARMAERLRFGKVRETLVFDQYRGGGVLVTDTYGGKLVENVVQAEARDVMAAAVVRLENSLTPMVLHVHDEGLTHVPTPEGVEEFVGGMSTLPEWAEGFPCEVKGYACRRYRKSPPPGGVEVVARDGKVVSR